VHKSGKLSSKVPATHRGLTWNVYINRVCVAFILIKIGEEASSQGLPTNTA